MNSTSAWSGASKPPRPFTFEHSGDRYGWVEGANDTWHHTLFIQNGRILDTEDIPMMTGLENDPILLRMTGCPNGCARPSLGEIGFIGKAPGKYNLYLGAGFHGQRLNKLYRENINEEQILAELTPILHRYAREREQVERFGDFVIKTGYVKEVFAGKDFHS